MASKEEIELYQTIYKMAFDRDAHFFYTNHINVIIDFLQENYWGESLEIRATLLCKLLEFDAEVHPELKKELKQKAKELKSLFVTPNPSADQSF